MLCAKYHLKMSTIYRDTQSWTSKWSAMGNDPVLVTWLYLYTKHGDEVRMKYKQMKGLKRGEVREEVL